MSIKNGQMRHGELDFTIARLGAGRILSPMSGVRFTGENERVLYHARLEELEAWRRQGGDPPAMEVAGPREMLFFDSATLACGIVTCGGICPGLNDVIRAIVLSLHHHYGVKTIHGFRFGYEGLVRRHAIKEHFRRVGMEISLKYIDPSYAIRSLPAIAHDAAFCLLLGHNAVHAGMSGRTNMVVGFWNDQFTHVPIPLAVSERKKLDPAGPLWSSVLASAGQPRDMR